MYVIGRLAASAVGYSALSVAIHSTIIPVVFACGVLFILSIAVLCATD